MKIYEKLTKIQNELKAPKSQYNSFGKYNYRNTEDILEALKPLLLKHGAVINISDEIELIGDRYYVKATATITDIEDKSYSKSTAYAREDIDKKGMDLSQLTGSTSSYARKYALNGLFAIDDTKDSDYTNKGEADKSSKPQAKPTLTNKPQAKTQQPKAQQGQVRKDSNLEAIKDGSLASDPQLSYIDKLLKSKNYTETSLLAYTEKLYGKDNLKSLTKQEASEVINHLQEVGK